MKIIFTGIQGCGKGTQANLLSSKINSPIIGMGELLRWHIVNETDISKLYPREAMESGILAPEEATQAVLKYAIEESPDTFILDGYPRNEDQYTFLKTLTDIDYVIQMDLPEEIAIERMKSRNRDDDSDDAINTRLSIYKESTAPLLDKYEEDSIPVIHINATLSIDEIHKAITNELII